MKGRDGARISADRLLLLEDFLHYFAFRDLTFAFELKTRGIAEDVLQLLTRYQVKEKSFITSFHPEDLKAARASDGKIRLGWLTRTFDAKCLAFIKEYGINQLCLPGSSLTKDLVDAIQAQGISVRAWAVGSPEIMKQVLESGARGGMTIDYPDVLKQYLDKTEAKASGGNKKG